MRISIVFGAIVALSFAFAASAESSSPSFDEIRAQQLEIGGAARAGSGVFEELPTRDRERLLERQAVVLELIDGKETADQLDESVRMEVFNHLEEIAAIVQQAEDSRVVCEYRKKVGSHMKARVCKTVAERRREREEAVDAMNRRSICGNCRDL